MEQIKIRTSKLLKLLKTASTQGIIEEVCLEIIDGVASIHAAASGDVLIVSTHVETQGSDIKIGLSKLTDMIKCLSRLGEECELRVDRNSSHLILKDRNKTLRFAAKSDEIIERLGSDELDEAGFDATIDSCVYSVVLEKDTVDDIVFFLSMDKSSKDTEVTVIVDRKGITFKGSEDLATKMEVTIPVDSQNSFKMVSVIGAEYLLGVLKTLEWHDTSPEVKFNEQGYVVVCQGSETVWSITPWEEV